MAAQVVEQPGLRYSEALAMTSNRPSPGLHGPVKWPCKSYKKIAQYLDIGVEEMKSWMISEDHFASFYTDLYLDWLKEKKKKGIKSQGPKLGSVLAAIVQNEAHGDTKYTRDNIKKEGWEEVDFYAYCLLRLIKANTYNRGGIFHGHSLSDVEKQERMWLCILKATSEITDSKMQAPGFIPPAFITYNQRPVTSPKRPREEEPRNNLEKVMLGPYTVQAPIYKDGNRQVSDEEPSLPSEDSDGANAESEEEKESDDAAAPNSHVEISATSMPISEGSYKDQVKTAFAAMKLARNKANPLDIKTDYGCYIKLYLLARSFDDAIVIQQLYAVQRVSISGGLRKPNADGGDYGNDGTNEDEGDGDYDSSKDEQSYKEYSTDDDDEDYGGSSYHRGEEGDREPGDYVGFEDYREHEDRSGSEDKSTDTDDIHGLDNEEDSTDFDDVCGLDDVDHAQGPDNVGDAHGPDDVDDAQTEVLARVDADVDVDAYNAESRSWQEKLDRMEAAAKHLAFDITPASAEDTKRSQDIEKMLDNKDLQRLDYESACKSLGIKDPAKPRLKSMGLGRHLLSWQVTGIKGIQDIQKAGKTKGVVLADTMGLGKTMQIIAYIHVRLAERKEALKRFKSKTGPKPKPARPTLLIVPKDLIAQWIEEIRDFSTVLTAMVYHGDVRAVPPSVRKIKGILGPGSGLFNGKESNSSIVIVTSLPTLVIRHGPNVLAQHRSSEGWSAKAVAKNMTTLLDDDHWDRSLSGKFDVVAIDEAHCIKNEKTKGHTTIQWLNADFHILATASPLPNSISDWTGFMEILDANRDLWSKESLSDLGVDDDVNPFALKDSHPASVLQCTKVAVHRFITGDGAVRSMAGLYLQRVWRQCLIRRTYGSPDPAKLSQSIGVGLPSLHNRRIVCAFTPSEKQEYETFAIRPLARLMRRLDDGKIVWNAKYSRQLILNSTWTGYHYIGDLLKAKHIKSWRSYPDILYRLVCALHSAQTKALGVAKFQLPEPDDEFGLLQVVCTGSPKVRHTLRLIAELMVLMKRKVLFWCSSPANQILLYGIFQAVGIDAIAYTAQMSTAERRGAVTAFTKNPDKCRAFIANYSVGSVGLNLQALCSHCVEFDCPANIGQQQQATGRIRRVGQRFPVQRFEFSVQESFQDRQIANLLMKAIPGCMAELNMKLRTSDTDEAAGKEVDEDVLDKASDGGIAENEVAIEDGEVTYSVGEWYVFEGKLLSRPDTRLTPEVLQILQPLEPEKFMEIILLILAGKSEIQYQDPGVRWISQKITGDFNPEEEIQSLGEL